jgi:hypothetical protein
MDGRIEGRLYRRIVHKYFLNDLMFELRLQAKHEAVAFIREHLDTALLVEDRYKLLAYALEQAPRAGLFCEFGVAGGKTIRRIAERVTGLVHGFDSFEGLPEDWAGTDQRRGSFSQKGRLPKVPANVRFHVGWFDATIPAFLKGDAGDVAFLHMDADIYSSTKIALTLLKDRIKPGAVMVFDEYLNYPAWAAHEHRALSEFLAETGLACRYIGFSTLRGQAAVKICSPNGSS